MKSRFVTLAFLVILFQGISHADSIYAVAGNLSIIGNNACTPSPCKQTVSFSFELGYQAQPAFGGTGTAYVPYIVAGTMSATSIGPLGTFVGFEGLGFDTGNYIPFTNADDSVEIDLREIGGTLMGEASPFPGPPSFPNALLFSCTGACAQDFRLGTIGTVEATVTPVSEGSEVLMVLVGAIGVLGFALKARDRVVSDFN